MLSIASAGCGVYQLSSGAEPRVLGVGSVEQQPTAEGRLYRVTIPGLGIRTGYLGGGFSLGWHESLVFCVETQSGNPEVDCIAAQNSSVGLDVSGSGLSLGYDRAFRVPKPAMESGVQEIIYSQEAPGKTVVIRRVFR